jgi:hypothetical protein
MFLAQLLAHINTLLLENYVCRCMKSCRHTGLDDGSSFMVVGSTRCSLSVYGRDLGSYLVTKLLVLPPTVVPGTEKE